MLDPFPEADGRSRLSPVRVIGIGSPFGADRIGWEVARRLARERQYLETLPAGSVSVSCADRPGIRLLEWLETPGLVILVDAMQGDAAPGTLRSFDGRRLPASAAFATTHDFGIKAALDLAGALGEIRPEVRVLGIETAATDGREPVLSALIENSNIINTIKELINKSMKIDKLSTH